MSNIEKFAPRLRMLIDAKGITVRSLAKDLNVSVGVCLIGKTETKPQEEIPL